MQNEELRPGMEVTVEYGGKWQRAKVIGPVILTKGGVTVITGWKLHVVRLPTPRFDIRCG